MLSDILHSSNPPVLKIDKTRLSCFNDQALLYFQRDECYIRTNIFGSKPFWVIYLIDFTDWAKVIQMFGSINIVYKSG